MPRKYGVYFVQGYGPASGIRRVLGHILRRGDVESANLLRITREESLRHAEVMKPLLDEVVSKASDVMTGLKPELHEVARRYLYLPVIPLGIEKPALQEAFKLSRELVKRVRPSLKQRLLPAYMLEKGGVGLGTNMVSITSSHILVTLHGSFPDGNVVRPKAVPGRKELLRLVEELRRRDYLTPDENGSPVPVLGAVLLKPVRDAMDSLGSLISAWFRGSYGELLELSEEIAEDHGSRLFAWDAFFYLTHLVVAVVTQELVKRKNIPFPDPAAGVLELLPL